MSSTFNGLYMSEPPRIYLHDDPAHPGLKAKASIVLNDGFAITNIRILELGGRVIVAFPSRQRADGKHVDTTYPISREARAWSAGHVLDAYRRELAYRAGWRGPAAELREAS